MSEHGDSHMNDEAGGHGSHGGPDLPHDAPVELPLPPLPRPPFWMVALALISVVASWIPLALVARARVTISPDPRIQIMQDMGKQPKLREQETNGVFADDRAMRPKIPGTVSRTDLEVDDHFYRGFVSTTDPATGKVAVQFYTGLPERFQPITREFLDRGQQRFNIYCYECHGYDGSGNGPVNVRAVQLQSDAGSLGDPKAKGMDWTTPAAALTSDPIRHTEDGRIFNVITNGIRKMPSYGSQIPTDDRWAIVAYVRALQFSQQAPESLLSAEQLAALK